MQFLQSLILIPEESERQLGIQLGIIQLRMLEATIVMVFDEVMVRVARKAKWIESKCVYLR